MNPKEIAQVVSIGLSFCAIWYCIFYLYRDLAVDSFRDKMFSLRDEFFDEAKAGNIDFKHISYGLLRNTMNGFIRYAHRLTFLDCVISMLCLKHKINTEHEFSFTKRWEHSINDLPVETKNKLEEYRSRMLRLAVKHVIISSPCLFFTCLPFWMLKSIFCKRKNRCSTASKIEPITKIQKTFSCSMQSTALAYGKEALAF